MRHTKHALFVTFVLCSQCVLCAQPLPGPPRIKSLPFEQMLPRTYAMVVGPEGQWISAASAYYRGSQLAEKGARKDHHIQLTHGRAIIEMPAEYPGYAVDFCVPTDEPIQLIFVEDGRVKDRVRTQSKGHHKIKFGITGVLQKLKAPEIIPPEDKRIVAQTILSSIFSGDSASVLSSVSRVDAEALDAYSRHLTRVFGKQRENQLEGWAYWSAKNNQGVFSGALRFEHDEPSFMMHVDGDKVLDFVIDSVAATKWEVDEVAVAAYGRVVEKLVNNMLSEDFELARESFSPALRSTISDSLMHRMVENVHLPEKSQIETYRMRQYHVQNLQEEKRQRLIADFDFETKQGVPFRSRATFALRRYRSQVPKAALIGLQLGPSAPSITEEHMHELESILKDLFRGDTTELIEALHPRVRPLIDETQVKQFAEEVSTKVGEIQESIEWSDWFDEMDGSGLIGEIATVKGAINVTLNILEDKLVGLTLRSTPISGTTLTCLNCRDQVKDFGDDFWKRMLAGEFQGAHELLSETFRERYSEDMLSDLVYKIRAGSDAELDTQSLRSLRLVLRNDKDSPIAIRSIRGLRFGDIVRWIRATYTIPVSGSSNLESFTTQFDDEFAVDAEPYRVLLETIAKSDSAAIIQMLNDQDRKSADEWVLKALLTELDFLFGKMQPVDDVSITTNRTYRSGMERTTVRAEVPFDQGTLPIQWQYVSDSLTGIDVQSSKLKQDYLFRLKDTEQVRQRAIDFLNAWLEGRVIDATGLMLQSMPREKLAAQLIRARRGVIDQLGAFESASFDSAFIRDQESLVTIAFKAKFAKGEEIAEVKLVFDGLRCLIVNSQLRLAEKNEESIATEDKPATKIEKPTGED